MTTELDPSLQQRIISLAEAYPAKWEEVLDGQTEARTWLIGMAQFGLEEAIDRKAAQAWVDAQVTTIRDLDAADVKGLKAWKHSRLPALTRACGVPEVAPVEDAVAMAVIEGAR
jgi:hypothetical protein